MLPSRTLLFPKLTLMNALPLSLASCPPCWRPLTLTIFLFCSLYSYASVCVSHRDHSFCIRYKESRERQGDLRVVPGCIWALWKLYVTEQLSSSFYELFVFSFSSSVCLLHSALCTPCFACVWAMVVVLKWWCNPCSHMILKTLNTNNLGGLGFLFLCGLGVCQCISVNCGLGDAYINQT